MLHFDQKFNFLNKIICISFIQKNSNAKSRMNWKKLVRWNISENQKIGSKQLIEKLKGIKPPTFLYINLNSNGANSIYCSKKSNLTYFDLQLLFIENIPTAKLFSP